MAINLQNKKLKIAIGILVVLVIITVITFLLPKKPSSPVAPTAPPVSQRTLDQEEGKYLVNRVLAQNVGVNGYSWYEKELIYSTKGGIFSARDGKSILPIQNDRIVWSSNGKAAIKSGGRWFLFNYATKSATDLGIQTEAIDIASHGNFVMYPNTEGQIVLHTLNEGSSSFSVEGNPLDLLVSSDNDYIAVSLSGSDGLKVSIFDNRLQKIRDIKIDDQDSLVAFSPMGEKIVTTSEGNLKITNLNDSTTAIEFGKTSALFPHWINEKTLIVVERLETDSLGRNLENIWRIDTSGAKTLLTTSGGIAGKIDNTVRVFANDEKTAVGFVSGRGNLWLLSLLPNLLPTYNQDGLNFFPISIETHPD